MENEKKGLALHWQVIIGLLLGVVYAWASIKYGWNEFTLDWIQPIGTIFINILKLIAVPLVLFSIISGVSSLGDIKKLGRGGVKTLGIYLVTTMFAVVVGLALVNIAQPGSSASEDLRIKNRISYELWRDAGDIEVLDEINLSKQEENADIVAEVSKAEPSNNEWVSDKLNKAENTKNSGPLQPLVDVVPNNIFKALKRNADASDNILCNILWVVVTGLNDKKKTTIINFVEAINDVCANGLGCNESNACICFCLNGRSNRKGSWHRSRKFQSTAFIPS